MEMAGKKLVRFVLIVLVVSALTFAMVNLLPGDAALLKAGPDATPEEVSAVRNELGLDRGMVVRYFIWLGHALQGDLGASLLTGEPVFDTIRSRLPVTLELVFISQLMALALSLPAGIAGAYGNGGALDRVISAAGFASFSIPGFVMALLAIYLFSIRLHWLPATGYVPISQGLGANLKSLVLPGLSIALMEWVVLMRVLRTDMIATLGQNYILMARAKGLSPWRVLVRHALRPSSFTLITVMGIQIGRHLGEAVVVETIFALPGVGRLLINAIYGRDCFMVQGCVLFITMGYVTVNAVVDILYTLLDPRIRTRGVS